MRPEKWLQYIQCNGSNFPLDISEFLSSLYIYDARPYYWSFLKGHINYQDTHWNCSQFIREGITPRTTFPFAPHSRDFELGPSAIIHSFLDYLCSRLRSKAQYIIWVLNPTIAPQNSGFFPLIWGEKWGFDFSSVNIILPFDMHTWKCHFAHPMIAINASEPVRRH